MTERITAPTEEQLREKYGNRMRKASSSVELSPGKRYAVVLLKLADEVTGEDYPALASSVTGLPGILAVDLLIDHITPADPPENEVTTATIKTTIKKKIVKPVEPEPVE
jgi:hypothetical protein